MRESFDELIVNHMKSTIEQFTKIRPNWLVSKILGLTIYNDKCGRPMIIGAPADAVADSVAEAIDSLVADGGSALHATDADADILDELMDWAWGEAFGDSAAVAGNENQPITGGGALNSVVNNLEPAYDWSEAFGGSAAVARNEYQPITGCGDGALNSAVDLDNLEPVYDWGEAFGGSAAVAGNENKPIIGGALEAVNDDDDDDDYASVSVENRESAFHDRIQTYAIVNVGHIKVDAFLNDAFTVFNERQSDIVNNSFLIKTYATFVAEFKKDVTDIDGVVTEIFQILYIHCWTEVMDIDAIARMREWFDEFITNRKKTRMEEFTINGSGWTLSKILELVILTTNLIRFQDHHIYHCLGKSLPN